MTTTANLDYNFELNDRHVTTLPDGSLRISGWASNFDVDRSGDQVTRAALAKALEGYFRNPQLLYGHAYSRPAGVVTRAKVTDQGLWIEATVAKPAAGADPVVVGYFDLVKRGYMRALSIGGKWKRDAMKRLIEIDLREVSLASVGVNSGTMLSAQMAKAFGDDPMTLDDLHRAAVLAEVRMVRLDLAAERRALRR